MTKQSNSSAFGQSEPTDGRKPFEWASKYTDPVAIKKQRSEAIYLGILLFLTPLLMAVIFPALMGGLAGIKVTPMLCLIPIFNASQMIRSILLGDATMTNFTITTVANLVYAAVAFWIATKTFENENVLFRS